MQGYQIKILEQVHAIPWWWFDALLLWVGLMGLALWVCGRGVVKPLFILLGLVASGAAAAVAADRFYPQSPILLWSVGGALAGGLLAWAIYRLGVALAVMVMMGLVAPALLLMVARAPWPAVGQPISEARTSLNQIIEQGKVEDTKSKITARQAAAMVSVKSIVDKASGELSAQCRQWWSDLPAALRWGLIAAIAAGVVLGLVGGLVFGNFSAALVTSGMGVGMVSLALWRLTQHLPASLNDLLPQRPWILAATLGTAILLGITLQWFIYGKTKVKAA